MVTNARSAIARYLPENSLRQRIAGGAFWSILGSGLSQALGLLVNIVCARWLGKAEYGELGIVLSTVNLFITFAAMGLGVTATKYVAQFRTSDPGRAGRIIGMSALTSSFSGAVIGILMFLAAPWLAVHSLHAPQLGNMLRLGAVMMFFAAVNGSQIGALSGLEAFKSLAMANLARALCSFPIVIFGVYHGGVYGAVCANALVSFLNYLIHRVILLRQCRRFNIEVSYSFDRSDLSFLLHFSIPVLVASFSFTPAVWWSNALLATHSGYAESGIFNAASQWQNVTMFFANSVANIGLPMLASVVSNRDYAQYRKYLTVNFLLTSGLAALVAVPIALCSPWIMRMYGTGFSDGALTLVFICLSSVISAMNISVGQAIWSLNAARSGMALAMVRAIALVVSSYFLTSRGAVGLALSYVIMGSVQTFVQVPFMYWLLRKHFRFCSVSSDTEETELAATPDQ